MKSLNEISLILDRTIFGCTNLFQLKSFGFSCLNQAKLSQQRLYGFIKEYIPFRLLRIGISILVCQIVSSRFQLNRLSSPKLSSLIFVAFLEGESERVVCNSFSSFVLNLKSSGKCRHGLKR